MCLKRKQDIDKKCVLNAQFEGWLRASSKKSEWWGNKGSGSAIGSSGQRKLNSERIETNTEQDERVKEGGKEMELHIKPKKSVGKRQEGKGKGD